MVKVEVSLTEGTMTNSGSPGLLRRILSALGRGLLGRSSRDSMRQFTGSEAYWDRVIAAQLGWPQKATPVNRPSLH